MYGYDRSATLDDDATLNDTTRNDATHDDLAPPDDDDTPNVKRKRRLEGLALAVCFIPKSQTCNSYKLNSFPCRPLTPPGQICEILSQELLADPPTTRWIIGSSPLTTRWVIPLQTPTTHEH
jgi:hypothetical protein